MPEQASIAVTGEGVAYGSPDQCKVRISLNQLADTAADALNGTAETAAQAISVLNELHVEQCDVETVGLSVQDFFDKTQQKITGRMGSYQLDLTIRPIDGVGSVLASLSDAVGDALQIRGINLTIEDSEPLKSQARQIAIADAKERAAEIAQGMGVQLGTVLSIQEDSAGMHNNSSQAERRKMSGGASAASLPLEGGDVSASSSVTVIWAIEPKRTGRRLGVKEFSYPSPTLETASSAQCPTCDKGAGPK